MAELVHAITEAERKRRVCRAAVALDITYAEMLMVLRLAPDDLHSARVSISGGRLWPDPEVDG